jgi:hypothetical protein
MMNIKTHKWYKDLDTSISECDYYFPDEKYGIRYCIQLQIEPGDTYWSADLYKCDEDWNITEYWQRITLPDKYYEWDYRTLQLDVILVVQKLFPHILWPAIPCEIEEVKLTRDSTRMPDSLLFLDSFQPTLACPDELYVKGNIGLLDVGYRVAIIGEEDATEEELTMAYKLGRYHSSDVVVCRLEHGVDAAARQGCLDAKGRVIAVTSDGLDVASKENADMISRILSNRGLVVTVNKDNSMNSASCMLVQIALANKVVVVSCEKESRTMQAVEFARKIGKPIFAVDNGRSGNRYLIDNGIATNV